LFKSVASCLAGEALLAGEKLLDVVKICLKILSGCGEKLVVVVQTVVHALFLLFHTSCFCTYPRAHASFLCTAIPVVWMLPVLIFRDGWSTILYVHCVHLLMWSLTKLDFLFYDFSVIYYDFSKFQPK
jgi:hypothetical protein